MGHPQSEQRRMAVIYARVSDQEQKTQGHGLKSQETRCQEFARLRNMDVIRTFEDDFTGGSTKRPAMTEMLTFLKSYRDLSLVVIIDDISRLARGITAHWELRDSIAKAGGQLMSPSIAFGESSDDRLIENMLASVSQHQREKNAEQVKNRMRARALNGYWGFWAPRGYKFQAVRGEGKVMVRDEPVASIVQEALEGYASGRFQSQAEVKRFLDNQPDFPKNKKTGEVCIRRVGDMLRQPLYAGYLAVPKWNVGLRPARHEGLITLEAHQKIQKLLTTRAVAPARKDISEDFPLRGFVVQLTSCWSSGKSRKYPYYLCFTKTCPSYKKSIKKADLEGDFEALLRTLQPSPELLRTAMRMFKAIWDERICSSGDRAKAIRSQSQKIDQEIGKLVDRTLSASSDAVLKAYENRIRELELQKQIMLEKADKIGASQLSFKQALRTPMEFLANPIKLWNSNKIEHQRLLMRLAFSARPSYDREGGFRTPLKALPFRLMDGFLGDKMVMVGPEGLEPPTKRL